MLEEPSLLIRVTGVMVEGVRGEDRRAEAKGPNGR